ncbi:MAG TPA: tRNA1(Val) (adenine(37)-N6)-methyltransferase [Bacillales bacterium]|nr:tRNA1(Val) (adenine(37)-N6)-methyltransferase [Bacillales bacterium]
MKLENDERLDYLFFDEKLKIVQSDRFFSFSLDSVLLAAFAHVPVRKGRLIDLCSGNGAIALMLTKRTKGSITAVEIQPRAHEAAEKSVRLNGLEERIRLICGDLKDMPQRLGQGSFDVVTCNPPYFSTSEKSGMKTNEPVAAARHELYTTIEDVVSSGGKLLKQGGKAAFVYPAERFLDLAVLMRTYRLEPKRILWVHPKPGKAANRLLVEGKKDAKPGLRVLPPLTVYDENDQYTKELRMFCHITCTP